jgi:hypothetical protein
VGPSAVLDTVVNRKISIPRRESNPRTPIVQMYYLSHLKKAEVKTTLCLGKIMTSVFRGLSHVIINFDRSMNHESGL